ncbi:MAG TPA: HAD family hydrolase [Desulfurococcales archaeon]|nr:HAD family hydrolase [Desulfurococcales archaeon]
MKISVISLDFAGVIVSKSFIDYFWLELVPYAYSLRHSIPLSKAKSTVYEEYEKVGSNRIEWYLVDYWAKKFRIEEYIPKLLDIARSKIVVYNDAREVIPKLASKVSNIIIATNTSIEFINLFFDAYPEFKRYIKKVYSCVSHYNMPHKTREFYESIVEDLHIKPEEILHVGDDPIYDYEIPKSIGINAIIVCRSRGKVLHGRNVISSLKELLGIIEELNIETRLN